MPRAHAWLDVEMETKTMSTTPDGIRRDTTYVVFWLYKAQPEWRRLDAQERARLRQDFAATVERHVADAGMGSGSTLRGAYSMAGLRHDADLALWLHGPSLDALQDLAVALRKTDLGAYLDTVYTYVGVVPESRYSPEHRPAFVKGAPAREYLSFYPFTKTHAWYQLPFEQRRALMAEHGRMGQKHSAMPEVRIDRPDAREQRAATGTGTSVAVADAVPAAPTGTVQANTINAFGLGDYEFVVAFESDDPFALEAMVEDLRAAEVRIYTSVDIPIFLARRKSLAAALDDLG